MVKHKSSRSTVHALLGLVLAAVPAAAAAAPAAELWPFWQTSNEASSQRIDHAAWQATLNDYLITPSDGRTLFRYAAVTPAHRHRLDDYLQRLAAVDPRTLRRSEQLPYWINLYNALTVRVVLEHPTEDSILDMGGGWFRRGPWREQLIEIVGQRLSLDDIEHRILRPIWNDQRIHFAVNCASLGCPDLAPHAFERETTQALLDAGERAYLHHPRGLRFDSSGTLHLSSIFDWYVADFGGSRAALLAYLASERTDLAQRFRGYEGSIRYQYDWSLNDADGTADGK